MELSQQLAALAGLLPEVQQKLADAVAAADALAIAKFEELKALLKAEFNKMGFDFEFVDGVLTVKFPETNPNEKLYTQEEADALVQKALEAIQKKVEELQGLVDLMPQKINEAIAAFKAELLVKVKELDANEDAQLEALLK